MMGIRRRAASAALGVAALIGGCSSASNGESTLTLLARDATSMTVHDIADGERFVASGIVACLPSAGAVTVTAVVPSGVTSGIEVTGFDTLRPATADASTVPISLRGSLSDVPVPTADRRVTTVCPDGGSNVVDSTYLAWEVTGRGSGPGVAERFTLEYVDEHGRSESVDVPVEIVLCDASETTGVCADPAAVNGT